MGKMEFTKRNEIFGEMENAAVTNLMNDKRMTDDQLDSVAGGYTYGKITITRKNGLVTYTMHNLNTNKIEQFVGRNDKEATLKLVQHNYNHHEKMIYLTAPGGAVKFSIDVEQTARELRLKRR